MRIGKANISAGLLFLAAFMIYGFALIYLRHLAPGKEQWAADYAVGTHLELRLAHVHGALFAFLNIVVGYLLIQLRVGREVNQGRVAAQGLDLCLGGLLPEQDGGAGETLADGAGLALGVPEIQGGAEVGISDRHRSVERSLAFAPEVLQDAGARQGRKPEVLDQPASGGAPEGAEGEVVEDVVRDQEDAVAPDVRADSSEEPRLLEEKLLESI